MANSKHLSMDDRIKIETSLANKESFKHIARLLDKYPSTISKFFQVFPVQATSVVDKAGFFVKLQIKDVIVSDRDKSQFIHNHTSIYGIQFGVLYCLIL